MKLYWVIVQLCQFRLIGDHYYKPAHSCLDLSSELLPLSLHVSVLGSPSMEGEEEDVGGGRGDQAKEPAREPRE